MMKIRLLITLLAIVVAHRSSADAQTPTAAQLRFFETSIRPALVTYCYECHSVESGDSRAGLLLDSRQSLLEGGDSGPAIVPGKPEASLLWDAINWASYEMPPSGKMPPEVIAKFKQWITMGAPDPRERQRLHFKTKITSGDIENGKEHWAFQPPRSQTGANVDSLVSAKLRSAGLQPSEPADAFTLLRRLNFDLIGLPPTPAELKEFQAAWKRDAYATVQAKVDELLERPQYGERWGRHWLDVARYAESSGSRNFSYPHAWRYRDYVIDSFNDDTPYDRFLAEQIAGDLLPTKTDEQWQENLIATGFLAIGMKHLDEKNPRKFMADMVDEQIDTMTQAVLGLTVACARCHDHKYDPIPTHDYYAVAGIFRSTKTYYGTQRVAQNHRAGDLLLLPILDKDPFHGRGSGQSIATLQARLVQVKQQIAEMGGRRGTKDDGEANQKVRALMRNAQRIEAELATRNSDGSIKTFGMGVQEADQTVNASILVGGEVDRPAQQVPRGFLQLLGDLNFQVAHGKSSGRRELVAAVTSKENPLTARVMVNRIWMHLLGKPLVRTPNNFGFSGMKPDNQELLDYLAVRFMRTDWSVKTMVREIVLSETYGRSSRYNADNYAVDPDNKLLWRANPRQLDAESMRDAMLVMSGRLELERPHGSAVAAGGDGKPGGANLDPNVSYRSVYLPIVRDELLEPLELFNFPDPNVSSASRQESIVPTQALYMMNSEFVTAQAEAMAANLERQHRTTGERVRYAFAWAYGRPATDEELQLSARFFRDFQPARPAAEASTSPATQPQRPRNRRDAGRRGPRNGSETAGRPAAATQSLAVFCQTLLASARFRILN